MPFPPGCWRLAANLQWIACSSDDFLCYFKIKCLSQCWLTILEFFSLLPLLCSNTLQNIIVSNFTHVHILFQLPGNNLLIFPICPVETLLVFLNKGFSPLLCGIRVARLKEEENKDGRSETEQWVRIQSLADTNQEECQYLALQTNVTCGM